MKNREIKFRAWWNGTMFYKHSVTIQIDGTVIFLDTDGKWTADSKQHPFIDIMQYTGFKDINGIDVYEGDILQHNVYKMKGVMTWDGERGEWEKFLPRDQFEIIGNVYEHPHLLNKDQNPQERDATEVDSSNTDGSKK